MGPSLVLRLTLVGAVGLIFATQITCQASQTETPAGLGNSTSRFSVKKINVTRPVPTRLRNFNRRLDPSSRTLKFPIIPPRLRLRPKAKKERTTPSNNSLAVTSSTASPTEVMASTTDSLSSSIKLVDVFEISSSDNSPSVAWPFPRRPASRKLWSPAPVRPTLQPLPKLLLPRPTRPAMYSLDGFVPKPSIIRITTTEAPAHIRQKYIHAIVKTSRKNGNGRQFPEKLSKSSDNNRQSLENRESNMAKPVRPFTAFARKGVPGQDYPIYASIPATDFDCKTKPGPGMYADPETGCQIWHMCPGGTPHRYSFMCPNGTIFNEGRGICDWWYNVYCDKESSQRKRFGRDVRAVDLSEDILNFGQKANRRVILTESDTYQM